MHIIEFIEKFRDASGRIQIRFNPVWPQECVGDYSYEKSQLLYIENVEGKATRRNVTCPETSHQVPQWIKLDFGDESAVQSAIHEMFMPRQSLDELGTVYGTVSAARPDTHHISPVNLTGVRLPCKIYQWYLTWVS